MWFTGREGYSAAGCCPDKTRKADDQCGLEGPVSPIGYLTFRHCFNRLRVELFVNVFSSWRYNRVDERSQEYALKTTTPPM
jgi:hypothetical protein